MDESVPHGRPQLWRRLDATVLHSLLLDRLWRVPDAPEYIGYVHDAAAAVAQAERLRRHGGAAAPGPRRTSSWSWPGKGVMMPHKSTSFGPKPATGLVLRSLHPQ